jgi:hypothetical protein
LTHEGINAVNPMPCPRSLPFIPRPNRLLRHWAAWLTLGLTQDAEADAIAVGIVAGRKAWAEALAKEKKASQGTLALRKAPARKAVAA